MNYIEVSVNTPDSHLKEILIAQLAAESYSAFEETDEAIKAFIPQQDFREEILQSILSTHQLQYSIQIIEDQNWNKLWENNFEPITVDDFVGVRAAFHQPLQNVQHEIIITPKMSFGTGHHATTWMMMKAMQSLSFTNKAVFDFGTGTGILSILAEKLGASEMLAVDYDDWCIQNACENMEINDCHSITIMKADTANVLQQFDIILANINRNIIEQNISYIAQNLKAGGTGLFSGLLKEDEADMLNLFSTYNLRIINLLYKEGWICMRCSN